jgi:hypothetical protein
MSAFPQAQCPRTAAVSPGVYGTDRQAAPSRPVLAGRRCGRRITDLCGFVLLVVVALVGWRESRHPLDFATREGRARAVVIWLALVGLASHRSPFVGFAYGGASTMWLLWLMTAPRCTAGVCVGIGALTALVTSLVPTPVDPGPTGVSDRGCARPATRHVRHQCRRTRACVPVVGAWRGRAGDGFAPGVTRGRIGREPFGRTPLRPH